MTDHAKILEWARECAGEIVFDDKTVSSEPGKVWEVDWGPLVETLANMIERIQSEAYERAAALCETAKDYCNTDCAGAIRALKPREDTGNANKPV